MGVAYGNSGEFRGDYWFMKIKVEAPAGDPSEGCGDTGYYQLHKSIILSRKVIGYCLNLPGNPAKWKVTYSDSAAVSTEYKNKKLDPSTVYRMKVVEDLGFELDYDE